DYVNNSALGKYGSGVVRVDVVRHPVEVEVADVAERALGAIGKNGFEQHRFAAKVHMRLEIFEPSGRSENLVALGLRNSVGRNIERAESGAAGRAGEGRQERAILRLLAFGIEINGQLDVIANFFADRVIMHLPPHSRAGQQELTGIGAIDVVI